MPKQVSFESIASRAEAAKKNSNGGEGKSKVNYLKLDKKVHFRPIGQVIEFYKFFVDLPGGKGRSFVVEEEDRQQAKDLILQLTGEDVKPSLRFAMNVIDRTDSQVKILEGGLTIFSVFSEWKENMEIHPGSKDGHDWFITPQGTGKQRKYTVTAGKQTPITKEEAVKLKEANGTYSLEEVFKAVSLDKISEILSGSSGSGKPKSDVVDTGSDVEEIDVDAALNF